MSSALVFMDTETTGLSLDDDIWEFAAIRREEDGSESQHHLFIDHDQIKCSNLPESFRGDHIARWNTHTSIGQGAAAEFISGLFFDRPHIVGAVPNFDTERLAILLRAYGYEPRWHYHLIDVENLTVGFLAGRASRGDLHAGLSIPDLPWDSDALSRACGVEPPGEGERHTAMGDARWTMRLYDAIMGTRA